MNKEIEETDFIEQKVQELAKMMRDWAIIEPELSLILGNVRRILDEVLESERERVAGEVENMPDMYPLDIYPEPWEGWQKDVDELAKQRGMRIDRISAHYARWQHKVTKDDLLSIVRNKGV